MENTPPPELNLEIIDVFTSSKKALFLGIGKIDLHFNDQLWQLTLTGFIF